MKDKQEPEISERVRDSNHEIFERNVEHDEDVFCAAVTTLVLAVFSVNLFVLLLGLFAFQTLYGTQETTPRWQRVVRPFAIITIVVVLLLILAFVVLIAYCLIYHDWWVLAIAGYFLVVNILAALISWKICRVVNLLSP